MKIVGQIQPTLLYCLVALSTFTESIYSAALPQIAEQLNTSGGIAQLSTTAYYTGFAIGIFTLGRISDIYGRRPIILGGISFYIIATFLISLSTDIEFFIIMRVFQAYGASVGSVAAQSMARDSYKDWELAAIYTSAGMIMSVVPSIGSMIGGYLVEYYDAWQNSFYFLSFFAGILLLIYIKFLPETNPYIGSSDKNHRFYGVLKVAMRDKILLSYAFIVGTYMGICFGFYMQAPFIFIEGLDMYPSNYGKLFLILTVVNLSGGLLCKYLLKRFVSVVKIKVTGIVLSSIGGMFFVCSTFLIKPSSDIPFVAMMVFLPMSIHLMGHTFIVPMLLRDVLKDYTKVTGTAGSIFGFLYYSLTAMISFLISTLHSNTINNYVYIFVTLILCCIYLFYMTEKWKKDNTANLTEIF